MTSVCILSSVHIALDNRVFYREARSLQKAGFDVSLIAIHPRDEVIDGVRIMGLPTIPRWQRPWIWGRLLKLARQLRADIYHFHDPELLFISPWLRLLTGKPVLYDIHEHYPDFFKVKDYLPAWVRYPLAWNFAWLEPLLARLQSGLIFSDDEIARPFVALPIPQTTLFNFPGRDFIDQALARTANDSPCKPIVLHLGGHERNRGTRLMIEAFHQVVQAYPAARLDLVGHFVPPNLQDEVQADIKKLSLGTRVEIHGRVPFDTIGDYLSQAMIGWVPWQSFPKNEKNIPTKLFEYMAYQLPIVASDLRSTRPFVVEEENGLRVRADDPSAHAHAIHYLLDNPDIGRQLGLRGQQMVVERYNWDVMETRLIDFYRQFVEV
jgi:glycosyltransferase involved in cell wall biosynthesis